MARRVIIACDICETEPATSQQFGFGEAKFEVDVCLEHGSALQDALQPYIDKGRVPEEPRVPGVRSKATGTKSDSKTKEIKEWAKAKNIKHNDNPSSDINQYNESH